MSKIPADFRIQGIIAAPGTAFLPNHDINTSAIKEYVEFLVNNNITGVFILGTLGEGMSLTVSERKEVASAWVGYGKDRLSAVIVHVGTGNLRESIELARHAQEIGATAFACMSPSYFRPANEADLVDYMEQIAKAAPEIPFYYYCINFMSGLYLNTATFLELASDRIPNLRGIKMSSRELPSLLDCTVVCSGKYDVLVGTDEQLLTSLVIGVRTPIVNGFLGNIFKRMRDAFDQGDIEAARKEQVLVRKIVHVRDKYGGGPAGVKAFLKCLGLDLGPVRLPLKDVPSARLPDLKKDLSECGLATR
uniref:N-acetylneuraminate lyase n=1 Tax=Arion vulgaris TaxID=1028688 RepID=A0A0B7BIL6_9EUPU